MQQRWNSRLLVFVCVFSIGACTQIQRRQGTQKSAIPSETFDEGGSVDRDSRQNAEDQKTPMAMNSQEIPKIGVILGPGMGKTMAHAGVLAELDKRKIPIDAVIGLGWGSVVGALYAKEGKVHELAWKLYKFKKSQLPKSGMFSSKLEPVSVDTLDKFLSESFKSKNLESLGVSFACPSMMLGRSKVVMAKRGGVKETLKRCLSTPPFYSPYAKKVTGAPGAVFQAVKDLKDRNIDVIILVDVLSPDQLLSAGVVKFETRLLWDTVRRQVRDSYSLVNEVIQVNTKGRGLTSFDGRKSLVKSGERAGREAAERLAEKYGL